ncbi:OLC1v1023979C1 [Oldenlandia corymbosa var. corymbosa]|uniref:E3 ubiquitin-protein ligase RMA n=1 Tax=Oldenlandia corymbosa var. corymbosa TaxID=529605 RepID=A0AAV1C1G2_OLDCO|nr:OLC1v1023979C1 [Oldenlandia corymbosa var. corymbosa]
MVMEHHFQEPAVENNLNQGEISLDKWKSLAADGPEDKSSSGLDCNICLDLVRDPVVTFCGHLYCWPCIYKWLHFQSEPSEEFKHHQPQCPVCKAELSEESVIPLYGRGLTTKPSEGKGGQLGIAIPQRPPSPKCGSRSLSAPPTPISRAVPQLQQFGYMQQPQFHHQYSSPRNSYMTAPPTFSLAGTGNPNAFHPMIGMLGEMVLAMMFGHQTAVYSYPSSYQLIGGTSPRIRRQVLQADKSLSRIINFLCCCMILCLLLF